MSDIYSYNSWLYLKIADVIYEYHLMDEIYEIYDTDIPTNKIVKGCLGCKIKVYRVWQTSNGEWAFKETEYEQ